MKLNQKIVQCEQGGYFTTTWVPGASLRAIRVGHGQRIQYCPVHRQNEKIHRVPTEEITDQIRNAAARYEGQ